MYKVDNSVITVNNIHNKQINNNKHIYTGNTITNI